MQTGVLDPRAPRQPALQPAQQDPRHLAADRGLPVREQTRRGVSLAHWAEFEDVADHCTVCHKCEKPCPVDIDFGDVSINMRNLLREQGKKSFNPGKAAAMAFLTAKDPATIKLIRAAA